MYIRLDKNCIHIFIVLIKHLINDVIDTLMSNDKDYSIIYIDGDVEAMVEGIYVLF